MIRDFARCGRGGTKPKGLVGEGSVAFHQVGPCLGAGRAPYHTTDNQGVGRDEGETVEASAPDDDPKIAFFALHTLTLRRVPRDGPLVGRGRCWWLIGCHQNRKGPVHDGGHVSVLQPFREFRC
jgi:hypothetical protein